MTLNLEITSATWSDYGEWGACSVSCGEGMAQRTRQCDHPDCSDGIDCEGSQTDTLPCFMGGKWIIRIEL